MSDRLHVLMVAEKPSIAQAVASALAQGPVQKRKGVSPSVPVYEYDGTFYAGADSWPNSRFRVTSTVGPVGGVFMMVMVSEMAGSLLSSPS